jgi:hypothetical protein
MMLLLVMMMLCLMMMVGSGRSCRGQKLLMMSGQIVSRSDETSRVA